MASHFIIECMDCGHKTPFIASASDCPNCHSTWREAMYDYNRLSKSLLLQISGRSFDLWRYKDLLPVRTMEPAYSLGEGGTPLLRASNLGGMLGCPNIFIKDERQGPTGSFKDRQAAVTIAALKEAGINRVGCCLHRECCHCIFSLRSPGRNSPLGVPHKFGPCGKNARGRALWYPGH